MAAIPEKIANYVVEGLIGEGGMGQVFKAIDPGLERHVAIKMIRGGGDQEFEARFAKELRTTARLDHPNIVNVYSSGVHDGDPYLVMEFIDGASLEAIIGQGTQKITLLQKLGIMIDVCNGLHHAHERGVIHRDIKTANIMVRREDGRAKIVDFGIARIGGRSETRTGLIGTVEYMSPEQLLGKDKLDRRTDIFSTGVVLYRLLSGSLPFPGETTHAVWRKILEEAPAPLDLNELNLPVELQSVMEHALAKSRDSRYETAREMALDLGEVQSKVKEDHVRHYLTLAEDAEQKRLWQMAFEHLQQVVKVDPQHSTARKRMSKVQEQLRLEQNATQARALKNEADSAYREREFDKALQLIDQAVAIDSSNSEWSSFRSAVLAARDLAIKLEQLLSQAERKLKDRDLAAADRVIKEALALDPSNTQARTIQKFLDGLILETERKNRLKELLDRARDQIQSAELDAAEKTIASAREVDPKSLDLAGAVKQFNRARDDQSRARELEALRRQIDDDITAGELASAAKRAAEGLRRYQDEPSLKQVMRILEQFDSAAAEKKSEEEAQRLERVATAEFEGRRILEQHGTDAAVRYLQGLPRELSQSRELADFVAMIQARRAAERREAEELQQRLAHARNLESTGKMSAALKEWQRLAELRPDVAEYSSEAERLKRKISQPTPAPSNATKIISPRAVWEKPPAPVQPPDLVPSPSKPEPPRKVTPGPSVDVQSPEKDETPLWRRPMVLYPSAAAVVLAGALIYILLPTKPGGGTPQPLKPVVSTKKIPPPSDSKPSESPPTERSEPPPTKLPVDQGTLLIRSNVVGAEVRVDGASQGLIGTKGRLQIDEPVGRHKITVAKVGYSEVGKFADVQKGKTSELPFELKKTEIADAPQPKPAPETRIQIQGEPGATVSIDGAVLTARISPEGELLWPVNPGPRTIDVTKDGYVKQAFIVLVEEGKTKTIDGHLKLIPKPPALPPSIEFTPDLYTVAPGQPVHLSWQVQNADRVQIDQEIGVVLSDGSTTVHPQSKTKYTLTADGAGGKTIESFTVNVEAPPVAKQDPPKLEPPKEHPPVPSVDSEADAVMKGVWRFRDVYDQNSIAEIRKLWPDIPKELAKRTEAGFKEARSFRMDFANCSPPQIANNIAQLSCDETLRSTTHDGKVNPPQTHKVTFTLKKENDVWRISGFRPK